MRKLMYILMLLMLPAIALAQKTGIEVGNRIPNIKGDNPKGDGIELAQLKGKVVLVDFWASWCPPCRRENPNLVKAYNQYKDKEFTKGSGFEIFSISLDSRKNDWERAIEKDHLSWNAHICDFKGWYSPTCDEFDIQSIPSNFLIDSNGIILAKNLREEALTATLKALLK